ncbi:exonuclease domain-containing protein [Agromyces archimandritae]|uniref:3'-5' exonuclease n=1 Tax=Agromyces archimandritae TaxID=2781962 RepID=A0A975FMN6_9MICO|nr:exonuclease domain-containing protein [Agromyces archimandritae]QTX04736.1 3'-5' exonuclease [Agromyces archimandritae]
MDLIVTAPWAASLAVFDLETTGIDHETSRIVTAHVGVLDAAGRVAHQHGWLIDPGVEIPPGATAVHGITTERARAEGMPPPAAVAEILGVLGQARADGAAITAYNAAYDLTILDREAARYGLAGLGDPAPVVDPYIIDKAVDRYRRGKRTLAATSAHYGVELETAHDAGADALAAGLVAQAIARAFPELAELDAAAMHARQIAWSREQAESYQAWRRANGSPDFTASGVWPVR